jgi:hypothetical protein
MVNWIIQNKEIMFFAEGFVFSVAAFYAVYARINNHRQPCEEKVLLSAEDVFEQLSGATRFQFFDISRRYVGSRVKVVGRLARVKELSDGLVSLSIIPRGVRGCVNVGVSWSEYREIASRKPEEDVTFEGEISYMDLDDFHELFLSDAKVHM